MNSGMFTAVLLTAQRLRVDRVSAGALPEGGEIESGELVEVDDPVLIDVRRRERVEAKRAALERVREDARGIESYGIRVPLAGDDLAVSTSKRHE